ncbi:MAG: S46 family peptidase [Gemmatimonadales bacterium]
MLADSAATADAVTNGTLSMSDPAIQMFTSMLGEFAPFQQRLSEISPVEEEITVALGRARFEVYGSAVPPDATFSLRIADGLVAPYEYNGTIAPVHTTFFGLYDRYYSYGEGAGEGEWDLPERWIDPPDSFDLATSLNFVSTADIVGGNSGSPVLNRNLEVVGLAFDGNIESLSGEYIFLTDRPRTVAVDSRGILEAMRVMYGADRLVEELRAGARAGVATGS